MLNCMSSNGQEYLLAITVSAAEFKASGFHLYYGGETRMLAGLRGRLAKGHVAVVDLRALTAAQRNALLQQANAVGAKVLAYVSIGELHDREAGDFAAFFKKAPIRPALRQRFPTPASVEVDRNVQFKSRRMDALSAAWRLFVLRKVTRARRAGVNGVFLDTVDTVDTYIARKPWPIARRVESVQAMWHLIRAIKASDPRQYVMMNRGLNLIGAKVFVGDAKGVEITGLNLAQKHAQNPDAVLWENAFAGSDAWSRAKNRELHAIHAAGHTAVFALGYAEPGGKPAAFFKQARTAGWPAAWARSSSTLHLELATGK